MPKSSKAGRTSRLVPYARGATPALLTVAQACRLSGLKIQTVRFAVDRGRMPGSVRVPTRSGRSERRIPPDGLAHYVRAIGARVRGELAELATDRHVLAVNVDEERFREVMAPTGVNFTVAGGGLAFGFSLADLRPAAVVVGLWNVLEFHAVEPTVRAIRTLRPTASVALVAGNASVTDKFAALFDEVCRGRDPYPVAAKYAADLVRGFRDSKPGGGSP